MKRDKTKKIGRRLVSINTILMDDCIDNVLKYSDFFYI